jgi:hypothetical protein
MRTYPRFGDLERIYGITWRDLAELEPRLGELLWAARQAGVGCRRWADVSRLFAPVRKTLAGLVGFDGEHRNHPILGNPGAYQVAYWKLFDIVAGRLPRRSAGAEEPQDKQTGVVFGDPCPTDSAAAHDERARKAGLLPGPDRERQDDEGITPEQMQAMRRGGSDVPQVPNGRDCCWFLDPTLD